MMIVGYARTSTVDQVAGLLAQERELLQAGADRIFQEQASALSARPVLKELLAFLREGDTLVATKACRLARSVRELADITSFLQAKGIELRIISMAVDTATPTGRLMLHMIGSIAEYERQLMLERQREGIAKARQEGKYKGRKPTARLKSADVKTMAASGMTRTEIAQRMSIGVASVYRILATERARQCS